MGLEPVSSIAHKSVIMYHQRTLYTDANVNEIEMLMKLKC